MSVFASLATAVLAWEGLWEGVSFRTEYQHSLRVDEGLLGFEQTGLGFDIPVPPSSPCVSAYATDGTAGPFYTNYTRAVALPNEGTHEYAMPSIEHSAMPRALMSCTRSLQVHWLEWHDAWHGRHEQPRD